MARRTASSRAFTLIELLVVIAIIGLLSSVVLASLDSARGKAKDAKIRSDLAELRTAMALYYDSHGTYPGNPNPGYGSPASTALQPLVTDGDIAAIPTSPNSIPYEYYNYGGSTGGLIVAEFTATAPAKGYAGSCRPFTVSNWCRSDIDNPYYCICNPY
jgi:prepilin-type N-terminal cleavage/methylation domain-containing protein